MSDSKIKLYFLSASRSIRTAWQLEELNLPYELKSAPRENGVAPAWLKKEAGGLGKFPTLEDEGEFYYESGNICEYLADKYDKQHRLIPAPGDSQRYKVLRWVHAAEATYMLHAGAILYSRWFQKDGDLAKTEAGMSGNVIKDFDHLEEELGKSSGRFLLGDSVTAADIMMEFSADFILTREMGTKGKEWPRVRQWLKDCQATETYRKAVDKTGYSL